VTGLSAVTWDITERKRAETERRAGFVVDETAGMPAVRADAEQIQAAANRAAGLTKQLLVFSRREATRTQVLDLSAIVSDLRNLLSHGIGAHVELVVEAAGGLRAIDADRGQVEQVLLNLAINARDAMPGGGALTIRTSIAELAEGISNRHVFLTPASSSELETLATHLLHLAIEPKLMVGFG